MSFLHQKKKRKGEDEEEKPPCHISTESSAVCFRKLSTAMALIAQQPPNKSPAWGERKSMSAFCCPFFFSKRGGGGGGGRAAPTLPLRFSKSMLM